MWPTPNATDGDKAPKFFGRGQNNPSLPYLAKMWELPETLSPSEASSSEERSESPTSSRQDLVTLLAGNPSLVAGRSLNPHFVEYLMGWAPGWTLTASNASACSVMELSRWKRHMRSELLAIGLPIEAAPAQLSLFG
jgi:hypothetical protein